MFAKLVLSLGLTLSLMLAQSQGAEAQERLRGTQFIGLVKGKTLAGTNAQGVRFNTYFLPGGIITYENEKGVRDKGRWFVKKEKYICMTWRKLWEGKERCVTAFYKDRKIYYSDSQGSSSVNLYAYIAEGF